MINPTIFCPCQSGKFYTDCCQLFHLHQMIPDSAEKLMRSRYTAYTQVNIPYIAETTVPAQQPLLDQQAMQLWGDETDWAGLKIISHQPFVSKIHSWVEFKAFFNTENGIDAHHERSLFVLIGGRWYFVDPTVPLPSQKQPCVCGSGKKFKHCFGYNLFFLVICKRSNLLVHLHKSYFEQTKDFIMLKKLSVIALATVALAASATSFAKESLLDRINQKGTITVGTEGTYAPFTYHDESGKLTGYDVEVTRAVAEKLGIKVEFKETNWDSMLAGLKAGRFDLVANQVALTTPERQAIFDKSEAYNWSGAVLVAPKTETRIQKIEDVKGLRAAQSLTSNYGELARKYEAVLVPVDGLAQSIKVIETKRADFTFNDSLAILDYIKKNPKSDLKIFWESDDKVGAGLVVDKGNDEALTKISKAIVELRNEGKLKALGEQFFGRDVSVK